MSATRRITLATLVLLLLALLLGYLFNRTQAVDIDAQNRVMLNLRELEQLDAEWNVNILRSHIGINPDYDPLSAPLQRMHELRQRVGASLAMGRSVQVGDTYRQMTSALAEKEALVEQFKSQNAVLRNALMVIAPSITELKTELNGIEGALVPARTVLRLDSALNALLSDLLRYNMAPDPDLATQINRHLATVQGLRAAFSPNVSEGLEELVGHANAIVRYRKLENEIEARIAALPTTVSMELLVSLFDKSFDQVQLEKQRYRSFLFAYSGLLLLLLVYAAWRLRRSYRIINRVNHDLKKANETLELRVAERTAALQAKSEQLEQLARHDGLTGLINYGQLTRQLEHALVRAARRSSNVVVMFIDLDGFKAVNDTWGHATGDLVLKEVARRVQTKLRKEDALARLGGDEFVILLEEVGDCDGALTVARLALHEIRSIDSAGGHPVRISASIGISSANGRLGLERGSAALLADADQAMYAAKQSGKDGISLSRHARWGATAAAAMTVSVP